jgi:hypothetical protein
MLMWLKEASGVSKHKFRDRMTKYKTLIRPVVTYGAQCWVLTNKDEVQLTVLERKVLRKISGPI